MQVTMQTVNYNGKPHRVFTVETEFRKYDVILTQEEYSYGGLAVEIISVKDGAAEEPFSTLTVWLFPMDAEDRMAFVDTNNNPWAEKFLKENGLATDTGERMSSGYCTYPLYQFKTEKFYGK